MCVIAGPLPPNVNTAQNVGSYEMGKIEGEQPKSHCTINEGDARDAAPSHKTNTDFIMIKPFQLEGPGNYVWLLLDHTEKCCKHAWDCSLQAKETYKHPAAARKLR
jgi:hypothetical protein